MIGGFLSDPAGHYPSLFGEIDFFVNFPYALPCIVTGSISIIGSIVGLFFLEETLPRIKKKNNV